MNRYLFSKPISNHKCTRFLDSFNNKAISFNVY